jgi:AAA+ ATPase superfamily predicted ATPase
VTIIIRGGLMFIGRKTEIGILENEYGREGSSLVIVYGRRRIGKTTLIKQFMQSKDSLYFLSTEEGGRQNLKYFQSLAFDKTALNLLRPENTLEWEDIFDLLTRGPDKTVIAIDEYPYLAMTEPGFSSRLQRIWDEMLKNRNVMLILCGSLIGMMYSETLDYSSPLYGRRTAQIKLAQIPFTDFAGFFPEKNDEELLSIYAVTGGVPRYIELFQPEKDLLENITDNILKKGSYLYEEPVFLLNRQFRETGTYFSILKTLAGGSQKSSEISGRLDMKQASLVYYMNGMIDMDLVEREVPVTERNPEKSKKGLYRIKDNFCQFWFRFVYPFMSYLEMENTAPVIEKIHKSFIDSHLSFIYERVCRELVKEMASEGFFGDRIVRIGRWWDSKEEIDIVGVNGDNKPVIFGECKYREGPVGIETLRELQGKALMVSKAAGSAFLLFSRKGFSKELLEHSRRNDNVFLFELFGKI